MRPALFALCLLAACAKPTPAESTADWDGRCTGRSTVPLTPFYVNLIGTAFDELEGETLVVGTASDNGDGSVCRSLTEVTVHGGYFAVVVEGRTGAGVYPLVGVWHDNGDGRCGEGDLAWSASANAYPSAAEAKPQTADEHVFLSGDPAEGCYAFE